MLMAFDRILNNILYLFIEPIGARFQLNRARSLLIALSVIINKQPVLDYRGLVITKYSFRLKKIPVTAKEN